MAKKYCCFANMCDNETKNLCCHYCKNTKCENRCNAWQENCKYLATEEWIEKFTVSQPLVETKEKNENPKLGRKKKSDSKWSDI